MLKPRSDCSRTKRGWGLTLAILPDHGFDRVQRMVVDDPSFLIAPVSNGGVAVGICAGAYLGSAAGKRMSTDMDGKEGKYHFVRYIENPRASRLSVQQRNKPEQNLTCSL